MESASCRLTDGNVFGPLVGNSSKPEVPKTESSATLEDLQSELKSFGDILWARLERRFQATEVHLIEKLSAVATSTASRSMSSSCECCRATRPACTPSGAAGATVTLPPAVVFANPEKVQEKGEELPAGVNKPEPKYQPEGSKSRSVRGNLDDADEDRRQKAIMLDLDEQVVSVEESNDGVGPFKERVRRIVRSPKFELVFGMCILANSFYIGLTTDWSARHLYSEPPEVFFYVEIVFTACFAIELMLRLINEGPKQYCIASSERHWAWLDTVIVVTSVIEAFSEIALRLSSSSASSSSDGASTSQFRIVRILRITRLVRIVRITRIVRFVRALRTMVHQLLSTLKSLFWAVLLLFLIIYLFAIFFTQAVTAYAKAEDKGDVLEYWSTLSVSMLTLYMAITGGINWNQVVVPLNEVGTIYLCVFVGYIVMAQLAVLNVLTGVFCQNAIESASHDAELVTQQMLAQREMYVKRLQALFGDLDTDRSGTVSLKEFQDHLADPQVQAYFESLELDTSDVWTLFKLLDVDEGNRIDLEEFVSGAMRLRGTAKCMDLMKLTYEHKWMSRRMMKFIAKTEERMRYLHRNHSPVAVVEALLRSNVIAVDVDPSVRMNMARTTRSGEDLFASDASEL